LCTGVSQMNSTIAQTISQKTKLCTDVLHTTEVMANFVIFGLFWPKFGCHGNEPESGSFPPKKLPFNLYLTFI